MEKLIFMLEVKRHDGPARLGNYEKLKTPAIFKPNAEFKIIKDEPMPYVSEGTSKMVC
jgi:hypothetical protein